MLPEALPDPYRGHFVIGRAVSHGVLWLTRRDTWSEDLRDARPIVDRAEAEHERWRADGDVVMPHVVALRWVRRPLIRTGLRVGGAGGRGRPAAAP